MSCRWRSEWFERVLDVAIPLLSPSCNLPFVGSYPSLSASRPRKPKPSLRRTLAQNRLVVTRTLCGVSVHNADVFLDSERLPRGRAERESSCARGDATWRLGRHSPLSLVPLTRAPTPLSLISKPRHLTTSPRARQLHRRPRKPPQQPSFAMLLPGHSGLWCTIKIGHQPLPEYTTTFTPDPPTLTCWIESQPGQEFVVSYGHRTGLQAHLGTVSLDGTFVQRRQLRGEQEGGRGAGEGGGGSRRAVRVLAD